MVSHVKTLPCGGLKLHEVFLKTKSNFNFVFCAFQDLLVLMKVQFLLLIAFSAFHGLLVLMKGDFDWSKF